MAKELKKAVVIATGKIIQVYRWKNHPGKWIDAQDCETEYDESELNFDL